MRDSKPLLLVLLSIVLIITWVYHFYDKSTYVDKSTELSVKDSTAVGRAIRDSLKNLYAAAILELDTRLDSSQENTALLQNRLASKLDEIDQLKSEIRNILSKQNFTAEDLVRRAAKLPNCSKRWMSSVIKSYQWKKRNSS
jgi:cell shape-determining protein MreC